MHQECIIDLHGDSAPAMEGHTQSQRPAALQAASHGAWDRAGSCSQRDILVRLSHTVAGARWATSVVGQDAAVWDHWSCLRPPWRTTGSRELVRRAAAPASTIAGHCLTAAALGSLPAAAAARRRARAGRAAREGRGELYNVYIYVRRGERTGQNELSTLRSECGQRDASGCEELVTLSVDKQAVGSSSR
eukprot:COSAG06_NODE_3018_length_5954_cov_3.513744_3_plen_190_part_00